MLAVHVSKRMWVYVICNRPVEHVGFMFLNLIYISPCRLIPSSQFPSSIPSIIRPPHLLLPQTDRQTREFNPCLQMMEGSREVIGLKDGKGGGLKERSS